MITAKNIQNKFLTSYFLLRTLVFAIVMLLALQSTAQRDSSKSQSVDITSAYKPVLRNAVKINLAASPLTADTTRPRLAYDIPSQNLFFSYQPIKLKPLSLVQDTTLQLGNRNFLKAGFGNFTTPYINAGFSFGDGKTSLFNLYANYISSKGKIQYQDFSELGIKGAGSYFTKNSEVYAGIGFNQNEYYQYGYDHSLHSFSKDSVRRRYQDITLSGGIKNTTLNDFKISYNPHAEAHIYSRENKISESSLLLTAPVEKQFGESVAFKVTGVADVTSFTNKGTTTGSSNKKLNNNLFQIAPELVYYSDRFTIHGGISPTWDNSTLSVLPNIYGEAQLQNNILIVQAGWIGNFIKNTYRSLSMENPYLKDPTSFLNTKETQIYGGVKASLGKHFSFNSKVAYITYNNMPLFVNDTATGKSFIVSNESKLTDLQLHGDLNFVSQDKFTLTAAVDLNTYTGIRNNAYAWGLFPVKVTGSFRWNAFKQVILKSDIFAFSGVPARQKSGSKINLSGTDLSAGAEFKINDKFSAWLDLNNIFNDKYQRWSQYPVYGLNVIGGVILHF